MVNTRQTKIFSQPITSVMMYKKEMECPCEGAPCVSRESPAVRRRETESLAEFPVPSWRSGRGCSQLGAGACAWRDLSRGLSVHFSIVCGA